MTRFLIVAALLLSGCALLSNKMTWSKPGATEAQAESDLADCTDLAKARTKADREIEQDIAANQPSGAGYSEPIMPESLTGYRSRQKFNEILDTCMTSLGYGRIE